MKMPKLLIALVLTMSLSITTVYGISSSEINSESDRESDSTNSSQKFTQENDDPEYYKSYASSKIQAYDATSATDKTANYGSKHDEKFKDHTIQKGIDISHHNGEVNWANAKKDNLDFTIIRVGYRGYESGTLVADDCYNYNLTEANKAGVEVGAYIFSQAITEKEARAEAKFLIEKVKDYKISRPLVLDFEYAPSSDGGRLKQAGLSRDKATKICLAFCDEVEKAGYEPMVYANKSMLTNNLNAEEISKKAEIWLAHYTEKTSYGGSYSYWQYTETGKIKGVKGNVDLNHGYRDTIDLSECTIEKIPTQTYTGGKIKPAIKVYSKNTLLKKGIQYKVSYKNNIDLGKATVTITPIGVNTGKKTKTFKIVPGKIENLKVSSKGKKYVTIKWNKASKADGYYVYRSSSLNGEYKKIKTTTKNSFKNTNLKAGREYFYKVRSYANVGKKIYEGKYSEVIRPITTKPYTRKATYKESAHLRSNPGTNYSKNITVPKGTKVHVYNHTYDKTGAKWYKVKYVKNSKTYKGYTRSDLLAVIRTGTTKYSVYIRNNSSFSSKKIIKLSKNVKVKILSSKKNKDGETWYKAKYEKSKQKTYTGYINDKYIK